MLARRSHTPSTGAVWALFFMRPRSIHAIHNNINNERNYLACVTAAVTTAVLLYWMLCRATGHYYTLAATQRIDLTKCAQEKQTNRERENTQYLCIISRLFSFNASQQNDICGSRCKMRICRKRRQSPSRQVIFYYCRLLYLLLPTEPGDAWFYKFVLNGNECVPHSHSRTHTHTRACTVHIPYG